MGNLSSTYITNEQTDSFPLVCFFVAEIMKPKRLKVFMRVRNGEIVCICLRSHRLCNDHTCTKDVVEYDQYQHLRECFANKPQ